MVPNADCCCCCCWRRLLAACGFRSLSLALTLALSLSLSLRFVFDTAQSVFLPLLPATRPSSSSLRLIARPADMGYGQRKSKISGQLAWLVNLPIRYYASCFSFFPLPPVSSALSYFSSSSSCFFFTFLICALTQCQISE